MQAIEIVQNYLTALDKGDIPTAFGYFADDVVWQQPGNNKFSGNKHGSQAIGEMIGGMMTDTAGSLVVAPNGHLMVNGNLVACPVRFTAQKNDGKQLDMTGIDLFEVENGKIIKVWLFSDNQAVEDEFWGV